MVEGQNPTFTQKHRLIAIVGPTATGKTNRAVSLCRRLGGEIISGDSRQVYKGMDLGTGKDLEEYGDIPYHLIDICNAGEKYNLHRFVTDFHKAFLDIQNRRKQAVLCGGSGMYIESVLSGIILPEVPENPELRESLAGKNIDELTKILQAYKTLHNKTDIDTVKRVLRAIEIEDFYRNHPEAARNADKINSKPLDAVIVGIDIPREVRRERISRRLLQRLNDGMVDEVRNLLNSGLAAENLIYYGLEYKYLTLYVVGKLSYEEMTRQLEIAIHQFAKRQMTWFRGMERRGFKINWLPYNLPDEEFNERIISLL